MNPAGKLEAPAKAEPEPGQLGEADEGAVRSLFGTPLLAVTWPDCEQVNRQLAELILDLEREHPAVEQSNHGGWQSEKTLQQIRHPAVQTLLSWIDIGVYLISSSLIGEEAVDQLPEKWSVAAWANVNRAGHFNGIHYHVGGFWSGVYYVTTVDTSASHPVAGAIGFRSPSQAGMVASNTCAPPAMQQAFRQEICMQPRSGLMLIFPSWLEHWVNPHASDEPRISIAFDASFRTPR
jgi:uncharacterized protein (TIGR02466 family)